MVVDKGSTKDHRDEVYNPIEFQCVESPMHHISIEYEPNWDYSLMDQREQRRLSPGDHKLKLVLKKL